MAKLLPILFVVVGLIGGVAAGMLLRPAPAMAECGDKDDMAPMADGGEAMTEDCAEKPMKKKAKAPMVPTSFAELEKQFVVPILKDERVVALVVASMALEIDEGTDEAAFSKEPKLRDAFLQVLFTHAHSGGFDGDFTAQTAIEDLKGRLYEAAQDIVGETLHDVLLTEIVRQDL
ncbi:MAG: flagellar basal body-associated FliL family protein [Pseudomonadota bacterium]